MLDTLSLFLGQSGGFFSETQVFWIYVVALGGGFYMAWSIGANDVANAMGTSVGSGALTLRNAIIVAAVFEFAGAFLVGSHVSETVRKGILPLEELEAMPGGANLYIYGMMGALLAAATWLLTATYFGLPVSTTHSIVGSVLGFGMVIFYDRLEVIHWDKVGTIVASWVVSPVLAGGFSCLVFLAIQKLILHKRDMVGSAKKLAPFLVFLVFLTIALVTLYKGLKPLGLHKIGFGWALLGATGIGIIAMLISIPLLNRITVEEDDPETTHAQNPVIGEDLARMKTKFKKLSMLATGEVGGKLESLGAKIEELSAEVEEQDRPPTGKTEGAGVWGTPQMRATERIFVYLQILSACTVAFAHGANDVANAVGPLMGVVTVLQKGVVQAKSELSGEWVMIILGLGGIGIVIGLATWGWRVIETIGKKITELTPTRGFSAEFGAAITILVASRAGLPISTTHTLVGAVLGVGLARGIGALNLRVVRDIIVSWVVTLPAGAALTIMFYFIFKAIF
ncbi:MAG: inorganic phosphate transporter [Planctomycetota bacterium]|nr:inorganic phosphate transporter [Planctomycetota bacterium]